MWTPRRLSDSRGPQQISVQPIELCSGVERVTAVALPAMSAGECLAASSSARSPSARPATALKRDNVVVAAARNATAGVMSLPLVITSVLVVQAVIALHRASHHPRAGALQQPNFDIYRDRRCR